MCRDGVLREGFLRVLEGDVFILGIVIFNSFLCGSREYKTL